MKITTVVGWRNRDHNIIWLVTRNRDREFGGRGGLIKTKDTCDDPIGFGLIKS